MKTIWLLSLASLLTLTACSHVVTRYFNDSDRVIAGTAGKGPCAVVGYDCVVMSKGTFRTLTTVNPTVKVIYSNDLNLQQR